jgi:hypothetical protein
LIADDLQQLSIEKSEPPQGSREGNGGAIESGPGRQQLQMELLKHLEEQLVVLQQALAAHDRQ